MRIGTAACVGFALAMSSVAGAQSVDDLPFKKPVYHRVPGAASPIPSSAAYMPPRAAAEGVDGEVVIACVLSSKGALDPCRIVSERPKGYGFAQAALEMAASGNVTAKPTVVDGAPRDQELVRVKIGFRGMDSRF